MKLKMDFKKILLNNAEYYGLNIGENEKVEVIMKKIINFKSKRFDNTPKKLYYSRTFLKKRSKLSNKYNSYLQTILEALNRGDLTVNKYLSKGINNTEYYDLFHVLWGLYHLHIEKLDSKSSFSKRSDYLLVLYRKENNVYLVDIVEHRERNLWFKKRFLKIIDDNWPDILPTLNGITGNKNSELKIKQLRQNNINDIVEINGKAVVPTLNPISTSGTPLDITREVDFIMKSLESISVYCGIKQALYPHKFNYTFTYYDNNKFFLKKECNTSQKVLIFTNTEMKELEINLFQPYYLDITNNKCRIVRMFLPSLTSNY